MATQSQEGAAGDRLAAASLAVLDHVSLRTHDLDGTRGFLETLLDLTPGFRPGFPFPGYWLYAGDEPVVHLIPGRGGPVNQGGDAIDHVAFRLTDHAACLRKLDAMGVAYSRMELPELGERRLFVQTPGGIVLELVFREGTLPADASQLDPHDGVNQ